MYMYNTCQICTSIIPASLFHRVLVKQYYDQKLYLQFIMISSFKTEYFRVTSGMRHYWQQGEAALENGFQLLSATQEVIDDR